MTNWTLQCVGCGECCGPAPFPAGFIGEHSSQIQLADFEIVDDLSPGVEIPVTKSMTCIFLTPDKRCAVYEDRPDVCRLYGTIPALRCPKREVNDYERKAINECVEPVLMAIGLGATYAALELPPRDVTMNSNNAGSR